MTNRPPPLPRKNTSYKKCYHVMFLPPILTLEKWSENLNIEYDEESFRNIFCKIICIFNFYTSAQFSIQTSKQNFQYKLKLLQVGNIRKQPVCLVSK